MSDKESPNTRASALASAHGDRFVIILNRTQDVVNIATALRAMMNMGLTRMRLVKPEDFNAYRIAGIAHGSEPLIEKIEFFETLDDATADAALVIGTTARRRTATYIWNHPREAVPELLAFPATAERPIAIVFGREDTGLENEELDRCDRLLVVPTSRINASLNLSQAVLIMAYELLLAATGVEHEPEELPRGRKEKSPAAGALERRALFQQINAALESVAFYKGKNPEAIMRTVRAVFRRAQLNSREAMLLRAMAIEVQKSTGARPFSDVVMNPRRSKPPDV